MANDAPELIEKTNSQQVNDHAQVAIIFSNDTWNDAKANQISAPGLDRETEIDQSGGRFNLLHFVELAAVNSNRTDYHQKTVTPIFEDSQPYQAAPNGYDQSSPPPAPTDAPPAPTDSPAPRTGGDYVPPSARLVPVNPGTDAGPTAPQGPAPEAQQQPQAAPDDQNYPQPRMIGLKTQEVDHQGASTNPEIFYGALNIQTSKYTDKQTVVVDTDALKLGAQKTAVDERGSVNVGPVPLFDAHHTSQTTKAYKIEKLNQGNYIQTANGDWLPTGRVVVDGRDSQDSVRVVGVPLVASSDHSSSVDRRYDQLISADKVAHFHDYDSNRQQKTDVLFGLFSGKHKESNFTRDISVDDQFSQFNQNISDDSVDFLGMTILHNHHDSNNPPPRIVPRPYGRR